MFSSISIENARCFSGKSFPLPLRPLTLLCGTNSSGKSTVLKSLLLLRQTHLAGSRYDAPRGLVHFIGPRIDLGNFATFVAENDVTRDVTLRLELDSLSQAAPAVLRTSFSFGLPAETLGTPSDAEGAALCVLKEIDSEYISPSAKIKAWRTRLISLLDGQPQYELQVSREQIKARKEISDLVNRMEDLHYVFSANLNGLSPFVIPPNLRFDSRLQRLGGYLPYQSEPLRDLHDASRFFDAQITGIEYVGPTRAAAMRYYYTSGDTSQDNTGDSLPNILLSKKLQKVRYAVPNGDQKEATLGEAISDWICYLRTGEFPRSRHAAEYKAASADNILVTLKVKSPSTAGLHSLADVGFGYSQVLPILLAGLLTGEGGTILIEQPELHLNPGLQVRIAEFFVSLVRSGRQVLVETHSEHIVNMIRVLAAEDASDRTAKLSSVLYFQPTPAGPSVIDMSIREDGSTAEWPHDFFGESLNLSARLMKAQRRFIKRGLLQ